MSKRIIKFIVLSYILVFFAFSVYSPYIVNASNNNKNNIVAEIVIDKFSGRILYQNNAEDKMFMASTTKILTAITVIENCNIEDLVVIKNETTGIEGSSIYLEEGEILSVKDLLYGLMLRSGNDCAETLANYLSGSNSNFVDLMNKMAKKIGAVNSNFTNPHGLHNENHYTTAYDLALISAYALNNKTFKEIVSTKRIKITDKNFNKTRLLINKNKNLSTLNGATGVKTGYTKNAGRCLVSSCERNGNELICVVLNCNPMFERSKELIENSFNNYSFINVLSSQNIIGFTNFNGEKIPLEIKKDIIIPLTENEKNNISIKYEYPKNLEIKPKNGEEIGKVKIYCENNLIFEQKIYIL